MEFLLKELLMRAKGDKNRKEHIGSLKMARFRLKASLRSKQLELDTRGKQRALDIQNWFYLVETTVMQNTSRLEEIIEQEWRDHTLARDNFHRTNKKQWNNFELLQIE